MTQITVPDSAELLRLNLELDVPAQTNLSGWTGGIKEVGQPGLEIWYGTAGIADIATESAERPWRAFLFGLCTAGTWFAWPLCAQSHTGSKPTVGAGASNGYTLPLQGLSAGITILEAGQYMTVPLPSGRYRTVCLTADLVSNGAGQATATFVPALSETPTGGVTVETQEPFIAMRPVNRRLGLSTVDGVSGIQFDVMEFRSG